MFRSLIESRRRSFTVTVAGGAVVLLAGLAGWGGSTLANNAAADSNATPAPVAITSDSPAPDATTAAASASTSVAPVDPPPSAVHAARPPRTNDSAAPTPRSSGSRAVPAPRTVPRTVPEATRVDPAPQITIPPGYTPPPAYTPPATATVVAPRAKPDCTAYTTQVTELEGTQRAERIDLNDQFQTALMNGDRDEAIQLQRDVMALQDRQTEEDAALARQYPGCW